MATAPLTRECPEPPFNDRPITQDLRFSVSWMRYFTNVDDWMESIEARLTAIGARVAAVEAAAPPTLAARLAAIEARLTAAGL